MCEQQAVIREILVSSDSAIQENFESLIFISQIHYIFLKVHFIEGKVSEEIKVLEVSVAVLKALVGLASGQTNL